MHGFDLLAAQAFRSQFGYRVGQIHKARRQRAFIVGIGAGAGHQLAGGRIRHEGERLLLSGRVEVELDHHAALRRLRIAEPAVRLHLDRRQEGVGLPFVRERTRLRAARSPARRPSAIGLAPAAPGLRPRSGLAPRTNCGSIRYRRRGRFGSSYVCCPRRETLRPSPRCLPPMIMNVPLSLPVDVKIRRIGTVWNGGDRGLLTRQRHRARIAVSDLPRIANFHHALLTLAARVGNFRLPSAHGR